MFHYSTFGQPFDPDTLGDVSYEEYYRSILDDLSTAGPQPPARKGFLASGPVFDPIGVNDTARPFADILDASYPINRFQTQGISAEELHSALSGSMKTQKIIGGILGEHLLKPYPSGGARHPLEAYVVAKSVRNLPTTTYHFDSVSGTLSPLFTDAAVSGIDEACFDKGGIVTSSAVLLITCRWPRHNWKYRYSRSYRMVMLELGHAIQAVHLAARANNLGVYHCPSINDATVLNLLELSDDCFEGPLYAIGIGKDGTR